MKRFPHRRSRVAALAVTLLCAAVVCVAAVDPFIDDLQPTAAPQQQPVLSRATPTPPSTRPPVPPPPKPQPPKPLQSPPPVPAPAQPPAPPKPAAAPTPAAAAPGTPKPGEPAIPHAKGAAQAAAVPVPVATAPAKPVVSSSAVNITAVPTAAPAPVKRGEAVETKKHGAAALFDVKVKGTHVAISPSGDVMVRNPDLDINTMRVVQMIAGIVQAVKRVVEASKPAPSKEHADVEARNKARVRAESEADDDEEDAGEEKGDAAAPPSPPAPVIVKQKVTIVTGGGDTDGVEAAGRMQPLPAELIGDETDLSPRRFGRHSDLVDDAKPYARKLHYRVRRSYTPGTSSVGDVRFDGFAPITMQLQQVSTIPSSEFAPDSYRFAVDVPGQPTFYLNLPRNA